jgi:hypothetical protein
MSFLSETQSAVSEKPNNCCRKIRNWKREYNFIFEIEPSPVKPCKYEVSIFLDFLFTLCYG